ncbi:hypothetical protein ASE55_16955 [Chryseobacterium sp. Leaf201]|nr:hypothetical protein ASE55_16955 [Chryseobacterium sp. Leaf201]
MKNIFPVFLFLFLSIFSVKTFAQISSKDLNSFQLTKEEYSEFKDYLISKNLQVKDTVFIKYDFNNENCWNQLDFKSKKYIDKIVENFQAHISDFNTAFETAIAYNFRQPGKNFNKLKLWDNTIIIDDRGILEKLIFKNKAQCGSSAVILSDGSYLIYERDAHFELLSVHHNYPGKKF